MLVPMMMCQLRPNLQTPNLHQPACFLSNGTIWNKICVLLVL